MDPAWNAVDDYITERLLPPDEALESALKASAAAGLPAIAVSAAQGRQLELLARIRGCDRILEVGTLGGYSAICLARGLRPGGRLVTLELRPHHAEVAQANLARAGLADRVDVRVGAAVDLLPGITGPFDLVFIDADKPNNPTYFEHALRLSRPGTVIIVDNVVRDGRVTDAASTDEAIVGTRRLYDRVRAEPRVDATAIQTVGHKGYDGFLIALVKT